jgi:hypothetical protein
MPMRVMVLVKATEDSERGHRPDAWTREMLAEMGRFNAELKAAGVLREAAGLRPSSQGLRVAFDGAARSVNPGPFAPARDLVAGYWLWEVRDLDEARAWALRCPQPMPGPCEIELRPLYEAADLG